MAYSPTHDAPAGGLPAYPAPDPTQAPVAQLDPGLDVQLLERRADWAHIVCSNGWEAWVDARRLVARVAATPEPTPPPPPPAATAPATAPAPATPAPAATTETPAVTTVAPTPTPAPAASTLPSEGWTVPTPGTPAAGTAGGGLTLGVGQLIALVGAGLVLISGWLNWFDFEGGDSGSAYKLPAGFLLDNQIDDEAGLSTGIFLLAAVALIVLGVFLVRVQWLAIVGGAGAVLIVALYLFQANGLVGDINDFLGGSGEEISLFDGFATYYPLLAVVGGAVAIVGGVVALRQK